MANNVMHDPPPNTTERQRLSNLFVPGKASRSLRREVDPHPPTKPSMVGLWQR